MQAQQHSAPVKDIVKPLLEPGEVILWTGRPHLETLTRESERMRVGRSPVSSMVYTFATMILAALAFAWWYGIDSGNLLSSILSGRNLFFVGLTLAIVVGATVLRRKGLDDAGRFTRWARSLSYALTDRRVLILSGKRVFSQFTPEELGSIRVRERERGYADVEFKELPRQSGRTSRGRYEVLYQDRRRIGFKALADAQAVKDRVERWREGHREAAEKAIAAFVSGDRHPEFAEEGAEDSTATRTVYGSRFDARVTVPSAWTVEVRKRRKPYGRIFLDNDKWQPPETLPDWNVLRAKGPYHTSIEIHLDRIPHFVTGYKDALNSRLTQALAGELLESRDDVQWGRFRGYSITRQHVVHGSAQSRKDIQRPALVRMTTLHDGNIQLAVLSVWPDGSDTLKQAIDSVMDSIELPPAEAGARTPASTADIPVDRSRGFLGKLATTARVVLGLLLAGLGIWAASDQSRRADDYSAAVIRLQAAQSAGLPTLDPGRVSTDYDGQLAYLQGELTRDRVTDPLTGFSAPTVWMERIVELRQWQETVRSRGTGSTRSRSYSYDRVWRDRLIDSDNFSQPLFGENEHANPETMPFERERFAGDELAVGAWQLEPLIYGARLNPARRATAEELSSASLGADWSLGDDYLYSRSNPDVRLYYEYRPLPAGRYSLIGIPRNGLLDLDELAATPPIAEGDVSAAELIRPLAVEDPHSGYTWAGYAFVGLMLLIGPLSRRLTVLAPIAEARFGRRLLLTAGLAASCVLVVAIAAG